MTTESKSREDKSVDTSLIDWFLSLSPEQRLAELESRIAFFQQAGRPDGDQSSQQTLELLVPRT